MNISLKLTIAPVVVLLLISACSMHKVNKDIKPLVGGEAYSISIDGIQPRSRWWKAFNDPLVDKLITKALSQNLTLLKASARLDQAMASQRAASANRYPELSARVTSERRWRGDTTTESGSAALSLSWEIDLWTRLSSASNSADYRALESMEDLEGVAVLISSQVADTYYQIMEQRLSLKLLAEQIKSAKTMLELIELRFSYGSASAVDVFQQRQLLAGIHAQEPIARSSMRQLQNRLSILLGKAPGGEMPKTADAFPKLPPLPAAGVPSDLLANRPDLRRIYNRVIALDYQVAEVMAGRLPSIEIGGAASRSLVNSTVEGVALSLFGDLLAPIFDFGRRSAETERRIAIVRQEIMNYSESYLNALGEVENTLWSEKYQLELLNALEKQLEIAKANLKETRNRYNHGLTDYLPALTALQAAQGLERDILARQRQLISIRIKLYRALGGSRLMS